MRDSSTVAYAMAPVLHVALDDGESLFVGGNFWDGRATGVRCGVSRYSRITVPWRCEIAWPTDVEASCAYRQVSQADERAIVAFMQTLSDGHEAAARQR